MCAEYNIKTSERELNQLLNVSILNETVSSEWHRHVRLYNLAPALHESPEGQVVLSEMHFSFLPAGQSKISFSANTRLDDWDDRAQRVVFAYQKPTWREAIAGRRCIVPATEFIEPIYSGEHAGNMLGFSAPEQPVLWLAGIYNETVDVQTGEVYYGFSLLTDYALPDVLEAGHHRTVIILSSAAAKTWMNSQTWTGVHATEFLLEHRQNLDLSHRPIRVMKNWRARVADAEKKFTREARVRQLVEPLRKR